MDGECRILNDIEVGRGGGWVGKEMGVVVPTGLEPLLRWWGAFRLQKSPDHRVVVTSLVFPPKAVHFKISRGIESERFSTGRMQPAS